MQNIVIILLLHSLSASYYACAEEGNNAVNKTITVVGVTSYYIMYPQQYVLCSNPAGFIHLNFFRGNARHIICERIEQYMRMGWSYTKYTVVKHKRSFQDAMWCRKKQWLINTQRWRTQRWDIIIAMKHIHNNILYQYVPKSFINMSHHPLMICPYIFNDMSSFINMPHHARNISTILNSKIKVRPDFDRNKTKTVIYWSTTQYAIV